MLCFSSFVVLGIEMDKERFKHTVLPLRNKLYHIALQLTNEKEEAEDIVQETFLKMWHLRDKLHEYQSVEALAVMITKNRSLDWLKKQHPQVSQHHLSLLDSASRTPDRELEENDAVACIRQLIGQLPSLQQITIRMKDIEGYEIAEIAEITGATVENIRVNLSRARKKIREQYLAINNRGATR